MFVTLLLHPLTILQMCAKNVSEMHSSIFFSNRLKLLQYHCTSKQYKKSLIFCGWNQLATHKSVNEPNVACMCH